ncbi:MAG: agmatine deiminase family protein [bacterium]
MYKKLSLLLVTFLLINAAALRASATDEELLPIGLTDEEMTRLHEIGMYNLRTAPPTGEIRNPSEWEPMQGVIIRYPFGISYAIIAEMSEDLMVTTIVASSSEQTYVTNQYVANGVNMANTDWLIAGTNSIWTRDYGPWFIFEENGDMGIVDPVYNRPRPLDDVIPQHLGTAWGLNVYGMSLATPGGNHMSDGLGMSMSTRLVWDENTGFTHDQIDSIMLAYLGNDYTVLAYIESGGIHHIDCWAKFLDPATILVKDVPASSSSYALLNQRAEQLSQMMSPWGRPYKIVRVYCPTGTAYTNSIILNDKVFVPIFSNSSDSDALQTYQDAMPGYEVLGFVGSWLDDDAIHCRAMGVPDSNMLFIDHIPLGNQTDTLSDFYVEAKIIDHSDAGLIADSLKIFYSINGGAFDWAMMTATGETDMYGGYIPTQSGIADVRYYVQAADYSGRVETHPYIGEPGAHAFSMDLPPDMEMPVTDLADSLQPGASTMLNVPVKNNGPGVLTITFSSGDSWLSFDTGEQTLYPSDSMDLAVTLNGAGQPCGDNTGAIAYISNDPDLPSGSVDVLMHILTPDVFIAETTLEETLISGDTASQIVTIQNLGPGRLDYTVSCQMFTGLSQPVPTGAEPIEWRRIANDKDTYEEPVYAPLAVGFGGPDTYGHSWIDSDEGAGVAFDWVDISGVGTSHTLGDDQATAAIPIGFGFPFYDSVYTELYIGSNGIVTFDAGSGNRNEVALPTATMTSLIAMFWDDLDPRRGGNIYHYYDPTLEQFIVTFDQIRFYSGVTGTGALTFQVIFHPDGVIKLQYATMDPGTLTLSGCGVGIQNSAASDALQIAYHAPYVHDSLAVEITAEHWLEASPAGGSVDPYGSVEVTVSFDAADLEDGEYSGQLAVSSNDPDTPSSAIPVSLTVSSVSWVCGDVDGNSIGPDIADLVYLVAYMFNGGPPPPVMQAAIVNGTTELDIANLVYLVTYMFSGGPDINCLP